MLVTVKIKTKSNYRNLNGTILEVVEMRGKRVTCKENNGSLTMDFQLNEIEEIFYKTK
jgi:hypothetical protein